MALEGDFLEKNGLVVDGTVTDAGWEAFSKLLDHVGPYPNLTPGVPRSPYGIFEKFMSKTVAVAMEVIIVRDGKIFLTWRNDKFFRGWHVPGGYIAPRETLIDTAQRIIDREVTGLTVTAAKIVHSISHPDSVRFHDVSALTVVEVSGDPPETETGRWFNEEPLDLLDVHKPFWPTIEKLLHQ
jgi:ADP-ribose pyrophosphatase YjhB (NUDIX family)